MCPSAIVTLEVVGGALTSLISGDMAGFGFRCWGQVVHDPNVTWLATWTENVMGQHKYVFLAANSGFKGESDLKKYEKARLLKKYIGGIRKAYIKMLKKKDMAEACVFCVLMLTAVPTQFGCCVSR